MDRPRLIRGLRIAWSVWWGIVCVLLVVLWVRSYWRWDGIAYFHTANHCGFESRWGRVLPYSQSYPTQSVKLQVFSKPIGDGPPPQPTSTAFSFVKYPGYFSVCIPYWSLAAISAVLAS